MKYFVLLFLLIFISKPIDVNAQGLFVNTQNEWRITCYDPTQSSETSSYTLGTNTTFGNATYYSIKGQNDEGAPFWETGDYFREENHVVYRWISAFNIEEVLYNFNVNVGDSLYLELDQLKVVVSAIDSVLLNNNEKRKRIQLKNEFNEDYWIEGIGSLINPMDPKGAFYLDNCYKLCGFYNNNEQLYGNSICNLGTPSNDISTEYIISATPNPSDNNITLTLGAAPSPNTECQLYDISGRLLQKIVLGSASNEQNIDTSMLPNGLYFIRVQDTKNNKFIGNQKFIVQH